MKKRSTTQGVIVQQKEIDKRQALEKFAFFNEDGTPFQPQQSSQGNGLNGIWRWHTDSNYIPEPQKWGQAGSDSGDVLIEAALLRIHNKSRDGFDFSVVMRVLKISGQIFAQQVDNANNRALFEVTGPVVDQGTYMEIPVTTLTAIGSGVDMEDVVFHFPLSAGAG